MLHTSLSRAFGKQYPFYWIQEDDAYFTGEPARFFALYRPVETDYVGGDVPNLAAARPPRKPVSFSAVDRAGVVDRKDVKTAWHWARGSVYPSIRVVKREFIERYSARYLNQLHRGLLARRELWQKRCTEIPTGTASAARRKFRAVVQVVMLCRFTFPAMVTTTLRRALKNEVRGGCVGFVPSL